MSSACVCHTDQWCFYCEMYVPLERERDRLAAALRSVMKVCDKSGAYTVGAQAYHIAYKALEGHKMTVESVPTRHAIPTDCLRKERDDFRRWLETHPDAPASTIAATNSVIEALEARIRDRKEDTNA